MALATRPPCDTCDFHGPEFGSFSAAARGLHRPLHGIAREAFLAPADWLLRKIHRGSR